MSKPLTREEILECISYLEYAKKNIKLGRRYICVQLSEYTVEVLGYGYNDKIPKLEKYLCTWITKGLEYHASLEGYIVTKLGYRLSFSDLIDNPVYRKKMKNLRIKWVNHMIKELKKELS